MRFVSFKHKRNEQFVEKRTHKFSLFFVFLFFFVSFFWIVSLHTFWRFEMTNNGDPSSVQIDLYCLAMANGRKGKMKPYRMTSQMARGTSMTRESARNELNKGVYAFF